MATGQETKGQMLLDYKAKCTLPKYNVSVVPTRIFLPPFGAHEKEIRHFADVPRLRELSGRPSPFAPYIFVRDDGCAQGTGENESKAVRAGDKTSKIIETMEQVLDASKGAEGVVLNPFAGQLLKQEDGMKCFAPIFGWIAYTRQATARGNAVVEWTLGHPKGAVKDGDVQYCAFTPASMRRELRAIGQSPSQNPYVLLDKGNGNVPTLEKMAEGMFIPHNESGEYDVMPSRAQEAFHSLFPALLRLGGEPLYFEGATLLINGAWQHIILQGAHVKNKLAGLATKDYEYLRNALSEAASYPYSAGDVPIGVRKSIELYSAAIDDPRTISAGFDVSGKGSKTFSTLYYCSGKLSILQDIFDQNAMVAYCDHDYHIDSIISNLCRNEFSFGAFFALDSMKFDQTFRGHAHGFFSQNGLFGFCSAHERKSDSLYDGTWTRHFRALLPENIRKYGDLKLTGRFRMEADDTLPFAKVVVEEITGVEPIKTLDERWDEGTLRWSKC